MVDNFEDNGWVLDRGGVLVLWARDVGSGGILTAAVGICLVAVVVMTGVLTVMWGPGGLGHWDRQR
jgi:hypothetical protein